MPSPLTLGPDTQTVPSTYIVRPLSAATRRCMLLNPHTVENNLIGRPNLTDEGRGLVSRFQPDQATFGLVKNLIRL